MAETYGDGFIDGYLQAVKHHTAGETKFMLLTKAMLAVKANRLVELGLSAADITKSIKDAINVKGD